MSAGTSPEIRQLASESRSLHAWLRELDSPVIHSDPPETSGQRSAVGDGVVFESSENALSPRTPRTPQMPGTPRKTHDEELRSHRRVRTRIDQWWEERGDELPRGQRAAAEYVRLDGLDAGFPQHHLNSNKKRKIGKSD